MRIRDQIALQLCLELLKTHPNLTVDERTDLAYEQMYSLRKFRFKDQAEIKELTKDSVSGKKKTFEETWKMEDLEGE